MFDKLRQFIKMPAFIKNHYGWVYLILTAAAYAFIVYMSYRPESF